MATATLHVIDPWEPADGPESSELLDEAELERAARFVVPADSRRWSRFRAAVRLLLARHLDADPRRLEFVPGPHGKPRLAAPHHHLHFNLSHATDLGLLVVSEAGEVGVDLEPWDRGPGLLECVDDFCHPVEAAGLPADESRRARHLLQLWTAKEAFLKALGSGFSISPQELLIRGDAARGVKGAEDLKLHRPADPALAGHCCAVALPAALDPTDLVIERLPG